MNAKSNLVAHWGGGAFRNLIGWGRLIRSLRDMLAIAPAGGSGDRPTWPRPSRPDGPYNNRKMDKPYVKLPCSRTGCICWAGVAASG